MFFSPRWQFRAACEDPIAEVPLFLLGAGDREKRHRSQFAIGGIVRRALGAKAVARDRTRLRLRIPHLTVAKACSGGSLEPPIRAQEEKRSAST